MKVTNEPTSSLLEHIREKRNLFSRYSRSRPHFKRSILFDALASILLVVAVFAFVNRSPDTARANALMHLGGVEMSSEQLVEHVKSEGIAVYWFGPLKGYKYTIIDMDHQEVIVTYLPKSVSLNHPDRYNLTVETYANTLESEKGALSNIVSDKDDFVASNGTIATADLSYPQRVKFFIPNSGKIVEVQYPTNRRGDDVIVDAQRLQLISEPKP
jgi:hypothetical protein